MELALYFNTMKNQPLSEEFRKMQKIAGIITEIDDMQSLYNQLEKEYFQGDNIEGLMTDERFKSLPREMRTKLHTVIFNNMRQNYY